MLGRGYHTVLFPGLNVNLELKKYESSYLSFSELTPESVFLNFCSQGITTEEYIDFSYFNISKDDAPAKIKFEELGQVGDTYIKDKVVYPGASIDFRTWNEIKEIEVMQLHQTVFLSETREVVESITYDCAINFSCSAFSFSLSMFNADLFPSIVFQESLVEPFVTEDENESISVTSRRKFRNVQPRIVDDNGDNNAGD